MELAELDYRTAIKFSKDEPWRYLSLVEVLIISNQYDKILEQLEFIDIESLDKTDLLMYKYFRCIYQKIMNLPTESFEIELDEEINLGSEVDWSLDDIEDWLPNSNLDSETKEFISKLTDKLKGM